MKRLSPYSKPTINVVIGILISCVNGCVFPTFGALITKMLFSLMIPDKEKMKQESWDWALYMLICGLVSLFGIFIVRFSFGIVGENITLNIRNKLYNSILKKEIGWFDRKENSAGVLTAVLASDASALNGASTEGLAIILESFFGLSCGIIIAFFFSWKLSLVALACTPFMTIGGAIQTKF